jgi:hypothetical protein
MQYIHIDQYGKHHHNGKNYGVLSFASAHAIVD